MTTLEKIRTEIEQLEDVCSKEHGCISEVLQIFDKYASEECDRDCEHCAYLECPIEPCEDAVSKQLKIGEEIYIRANVNEIRNDYIICENKGGYFGTVREEIYPSVQPKAKQGHWKRISMDRYTTHAQYWYECDKCGEHNLGNTDFCPYCGCRMVEPRESESDA